MIAIVASLSSQTDEQHWFSRHIRDTNRGALSYMIDRCDGRVKSREQLLPREKLLTYTCTAMWLVDITLLSNTY